ncbi:MAG TPA: glucose-1-phosphate adenylyltransferase [Aggregatilineales bacterium]|nr:glucose-1-phosphate adenylyltransferase [Anaerolineales bacterium]HRE49724.1 glucose-1-phosphate adenylyltransferase [Aggregatilineales bacterium]
MRTRAIILAGGEGTRLSVLTAKRAKPAVPFGGKYRIIDFTLSNCVNSGIFDVLILTQYRPHSLMDHIGRGQPWDLDRSFTGGVHILQPFKGRDDTDWYSGTADAVWQNLNFVGRGRPKYVLILSGDHIYEMDYAALINQHEYKGADITICTIRVPIEEASRFGILDVDLKGRVKDFAEKPANPPSNLASMGIYVFTLDTLERMLIEDAARTSSSHDFGKDIIPRMVAEGQNVYAYPFNGYWVDVGTIDAFWEAHMDLIGKPPSINLNDRSWIIHTRSEERPPVIIESGAIVHDSMVTDGSVISAGALVERSVLSPGVYVGPNAVIRESVILTGSSIEAGAVVERAIIDKDVVIGHDVHVGRITDSADLGISVIGKGSHVPAGFIIGRNVVIGTEFMPDDYHDVHEKTIPDGTKLLGERRKTDY